jgi:hypothetical protein
MTNEQPTHSIDDAGLYLDLKQEVRESQEKIFEELKTHTEDEMIKFKSILDEMHANSTKSTDQYNKLSQMMQATINEIKKVSGDQKTLISAIPDGLAGVAKHHTYHSAEADKASDKKIITLEVKKKVFSGAAWGIAVVVCYALWEYAKAKLKLP